MQIHFLPLLLLFILVSGCAKNVDGSLKIPLVHRVDIQQGNVIDQEMINKLEPGMDKDKVKFIMGTPLVQDPFHSDRWDYIYSMEPGGGEREQRRITLYFRNDKLAYIDGDISVNENLQPEENVTDHERSISVPLEEDEEGFFSRMFDKDKESDVEEQVQESGPESDTTGVTVSEDATDTTDESAEPAESLVTKQQDETVAAEDRTASAVDEEPERNTNLLKRFWDRMTSGADDSTIAEGEESERDRRDAEMLEQAGEGL